MKKKLDVPGLRESLRYDLPAGVVAFLVAVPLCLGIALACGAPLASGLVAGMVGGLVVPLVSRAELSVSGPAAGLVAIVLSGVTTLGSFEVFTAAVALAGLLQVAMGLLRFGRLSAWFSTSVVAGMLAAIGVLLVVKQLPHAVGFDDDAFAHGAPLTAVFEPAAILTAVSAVVSLIAWERLSKARGVSLLPAPLVAVLVAVGAHELVRVVAPGSALGAEHMVDIPDAARWAGSLDLPDAGTFLRPDVWIAAGTVAVVASIESLLNVAAMDRVDPFARRSPMNRELVAQGLGNAVSGLLGGLPVTSVVVRSSTALQAGARTRTASVVHGVLLVMTVFLFAPLLERIPLACLAAILLVTGYKLASPAVLRAAWNGGWENFLPFATTLTGVVALDLLKGVGLGLAVAVALAVRRAVGRPVEVVTGEGCVTVRLVRDVPFFARAELQRALDAIPPRARVVLDAKQATSVHADVEEAIRTFLESAERRSVEVEVRGLAGVG